MCSVLEIVERESICNTASLESSTLMFAVLCDDRRVREHGSARFSDRLRGRAAAATAACGLSNTHRRRLWVLDRWGFYLIDLPGTVVRAWILVGCHGFDDSHDLWIQYFLTSSLVWWEISAYSYHPTRTRWFCVPARYWVEISETVRGYLGTPSKLVR